MADIEQQKTKPPAKELAKDGKKPPEKTNDSLAQMAMQFPQQYRQIETLMRSILQRKVTEGLGRMRDAIKKPLTEIKNLTWENVREAQQRSDIGETLRTLESLATKMRDMSLADIVGNLARPEIALYSAGKKPGQERADKSGMGNVDEVILTLLAEEKKYVENNRSLNYDQKQQKLKEIGDLESFYVKHVGVAQTSGINKFVGNFLLQQEEYVNRFQSK